MMVGDEGREESRIRGRILSNYLDILLAFFQHPFVRPALSYKGLAAFLIFDSRPDVESSAASILVGLARCVNTYSVVALDPVEKRFESRRFTLKKP